MSRISYVDKLHTDSQVAGDTAERGTALLKTLSQCVEGQEQFQ